MQGGSLHSLAGACCLSSLALASERLCTAPASAVQVPAEPAAVSDLHFIPCPTRCLHAQVLFGLPEVPPRYVARAGGIFRSAPADPSNDLLTQLAKARNARCRGGCGLSRCLFALLPAVVPRASGMKHERAVANRPHC